MSFLVHSTDYWRRYVAAELLTGEITCLDRLDNNKVNANDEEQAAATFYKNFLIIYRDFYQ